MAVQTGVPWSHVAGHWCRVGGEARQGACPGPRGSLTGKDWKSWKEPNSQTYRWDCTFVDVPLKALATTRKE